MNYPTTQVPRGPTLWPDRTVAILEYSDLDNFIAIPDTENAQQFYYRMNAIYNPDGSGSSFIAGLSEYGAQYTRYRVLASSIRVAIYTQPAGAPLVTVLGPFADATANAQSFRVQSTPDAVKQTVGNPYTTMKVIGPQSTQSSGDMPTLYKYISLQKLAGSTDPLTGDHWAGFTPGGSGTGTATDPSQLALWYFGLTTLDGTAVSSVTAPYFQTTIKYWVEFYGRTFEYS